MTTTLHFRALIVADKARLNHQQYRQSHDDWYYKMYFSMLKTIFEPDAGYHVYIDIKDTLGMRRSPSSMRCWPTTLMTSRAG